MRFVAMVGGPLDGESRPIDDERCKKHVERHGEIVHVYRSTADRSVWEYDLEASTIATLEAAMRAKRLDSGEHAP